MTNSSLRSSLTSFAGYQPDLDPIFDPKGVPQPSPTNAIRRVVSGDSEPPTPLFSRFRFPEIRTGSIRSSIFNLCSATLGAGALSLPYAFSQAGILMSTALLLIAVGSTLLSIHLLVESANFTGGRSYEEVRRSEERSDELGMGGLRE